jgi:hypothetical protein
MTPRRLSLEDLVLLEAQSLAKAKLEEELAKHNLPLPRGSALEIHVDQLLKTDASIAVEARARVLASRDAYSESLRAIGLPAPTFATAVEIEI